MRRVTPWAILLALGSLLLLGVTWNASFEATPANTDLVSAGDDRIRELKLELRNRLQVEHCFGSGGGSGCTPADNAHHREGSALGFYADAAPTVLLDPSATALAADDDGRLWVDSDGLTGGTHDDRTMNVWNGAAWAIVRAEPIVTTDATIDTATVTDDQSHDIGVLDGAPVNLAMAGGAGAGGLPMVTSPATSVWNVGVTGNFEVHIDGAAPATASAQWFHAALQEQIAAGAFTTVARCVLRINGVNIVNDDPVGTCTFAYSREAAAATAYTYRIRISVFRATAEAANIIIDSTNALHVYEAETPNNGYLKAELSQRW